MDKAYPPNIILNQQSAPRLHTADVFNTRLLDYLESGHCYSRYYSEHSH